MVLQIVLLLGPELQIEARVGRDAPFVLVAALGAGTVEVAAGRTPECRGGQLEFALAGIGVEPVDGLHAPLAVAAAADDDASAVVFQTGRDDLAGAGAAAVDQTHQREAGITAVGLADVA